MTSIYNKIADEISFRLLATKDHTDYDWLVDKLKQLKPKEDEGVH